MLVLLGVAGAFFLFELEAADVSNAAHGRVGGGGDLDQVQPGLLGLADRLFERHDADLLALSVEDADLCGADLLVGAWARLYRRARNEWWSRNRWCPSQS